MEAGDGDMVGWRRGRFRILTSHVPCNQFRRYSCEASLPKGDMPRCLVGGAPSVGRKLYVGNLSYGVTDSDLQQLCEPHGTVQSAQVIMDRDAGRSKGFGFVEMGSDAEAQAAIAALNGKEVDGRALTVNEARPKTEGGGRGGGGGGGRGGYGGGGGRRY